MDTGSYAQRMPQSQAESTVWINPKATAFTPAPPPSGAKEFHESLPGYQPTNLISVPELAQELGVDHVFIKDESERFGLPAFKALGAAWAIDKALKAQELNQPANPNPTLVTATDGNHGRAVANTAKKLGLKARIYIPNTVSETAIDAIKSEGAEVHVLDTHYDEVVTIAAQNAADSNSLLIQDTAWEGYPTMLAEVDEQLASQHEKPTHVLVPTGVGSLLQAVLTHYRSQGPTAAHVISVEPDTAACIFTSLENQKITAVPTQETIMSGLNCGTPSTLAWPLIQQGLSAATTVTDTQALQALHDLKDHNIKVGPCGAAALTGIRNLANNLQVRSDLDLSSDSVVVLLSTESIDANPLGTSA